MNEKTDWQNGLKKKKHDPTKYFVQKTLWIKRYKRKTLVQGRKMVCFADSNQKRAGVAILIPDKIDFVTDCY